MEWNDALIMSDVLTPNSYLKDFVGRDLGESGDGPLWLQTRRMEAASRFAALGFPARRDEDWRFTNITPIAETPFQRAVSYALTPEQLKPFTYEGLNGTRLVFVNGRYAPELSQRGLLPAGVEVTTLAAAYESDPETIRTHLAATALFQDHAFVALNTAALEDGAFIRIPRNAIVEDPIQLLYVSAPGDYPTVAHPRALIVAGDHSEATIIESYHGTAEAVYFTNAVTEVALGENATIDHYKVQQESLNAFHIATLQVTLAAHSNFSSHSIGLGGRIVRNEANATFKASGAECTLNGLYLASGTQIVDNHTAIDHAMPYCNSHELYKGILDGRAHGVFNGKILVRPDAQKTDAKQTNQTLLLSNQARIDTKPQLEIFADDVKCTHGATIGQLSDEALFYLRSRGIPQGEARALLTYAFAAEVVQRIKVEAIRTTLDHALLAARALEGLQD